MNPAPPNIVASIFSRGLLPAVGVHARHLAIEIARALLAAGLDVMEITFRHPGAAACVSAVRRQVPEMLVGAGTLLSEAQLDAALANGAQFGVTPGFNPQMVQAAAARKFLLIPGVATQGELEQALALGCRTVKIFPAETLGGAAFIKALSGPYLRTGVKVIPMGGLHCRQFSAGLSGAADGRRRRRFLDGARTFRCGKKMGGHHRGHPQCFANHRQISSLINRAFTNITNP